MCKYIEVIHMILQMGRKQALKECVSILYRSLKFLLQAQFSLLQV